MHSNHELRRTLKAFRRQLSPQELAEASQRANEQVLQLPEFRRARYIAGYVGSKGEIDPMPLLHLAHAMGKHCYLPILHPFLHGRLWFAPWTPTHPMTLNRYRIPEPLFHAAQCRKPQFFDLVFTPLLGFDKQGYRLGMGGGYYDRSFAFRRQRRLWHGPTLLGLAHEQQRCDAIEVAPWDIRLDTVITPKARVLCSETSS